MSLSDKRITVFTEDTKHREDRYNEKDVKEFIRALRFKKDPQFVDAVNDFIELANKKIDELAGEELT